MKIPFSDLHGAYRRADLVDALGRTRVLNAIAGGELRPLWRGVLVEASRVTNVWTCAAAAQLTTGPRGAITAETAATLHGCSAARSAMTHVLLPYGCVPRSRDGLAVHHGRFRAVDVVDLEGLRVLRIERVVADLLCSARPQDGLAIADEALRMAGDDVEQTRKDILGYIARREDPRGTVRGPAVLALASPLSRSVPESRLRMKLIERGFPLPEVNFWVRDLDGQPLWCVDLSWPELRIAVEYDGYAAHAGRAAADQTRANDLIGRDWIIVRVDRADMRDLTRVVRALEAAFAKRGYTWMRAS